MTRPSAPDYLTVKPDGIPACLKERAQWVCWRPEFRDGRWTKIPINPSSGNKAKADSPATWGTFDAATKFLTDHPWNGNGQGVAGIGYVFSVEDPFTGVDLDKCLKTDTAAKMVDLSDAALATVDHLSSYTELSPSGTGLHVILEGKLPKEGRRKGTVEMYDEKRFFCFTGRAIFGHHEVKPRQVELEALHRRVFNPDTPPQASLADATRKPMTDDEIMERAFAAKNGTDLRKLMDGDFSGYPSQSEADQALCNALAFWLGKDASRMDASFRRSGLMRDKWDKKHHSDGRTYGQGTIDKAIAGTREVYSGTTSIKAAVPASSVTSTKEAATAKATKEPVNTDSPEWKNAREVFPRRSYPWEILPAPVAESFKQLARSCASSPNPLPGAGMTILASAMGRTVSVSPKLSWNEPAIIWHSDTRQSGSGKTAPLHKLATPLVRAQRDEDERFRTEMAEHQAAKRRAKSAKDEPEPPEPPRSYYANDMTMEGLRAALEDHPTGGMLILMSELSAFVSGQNQYKKGGNDRENALCLHDGQDLRILRAGRPPITVHGARVSVAGGVQPEVFKAVFGGQNGQFLEDGTINRFLFTYERGGHYELTAEAWSEENAAVWSRIVNAALKWADARADEDPTSVILNTEAQEVFFAWRNELDAGRDALPKELRGFLAKAYGYALRLAMVINAMHRFHEGKSPDLMLNVEDIRRGIAAVDFHLGQAVDVMATYASEDAKPPVEISERTACLVKALEAARGDIDHGRLGVGFLAGKYNSLAAKEHRFSTPKGFGAFLRTCGLNMANGNHDANGRRRVSCMVWDQTTEDFIASMETLETSQKQSLHPGSEAGPNSGDLETLETSTEVKREKEGVREYAGGSEKISSPKSPSLQSKAGSSSRDGDFEISKSPKSPSLPCELQPEGDMVVV